MTTQMKEVRLSCGVVRYRDEGSGPVLLFVHGVLVNGELWRDVVERLGPGFRCIVPDWPLGCHTVAMDEGAALDPGAIADLIAELIEALGLSDVTLVGNDTGGALCQLVVARRPQRIARLVLTTCDGYEVFPPSPFAWLRLLGTAPWALGVLAALLARFRWMARLPIAYGRLTKRRMPDELIDGWLAPGRRDAGVRRDLGKLLRTMRPRWTLEAARRLRDFAGPALILWTPEDPSFPASIGERLARDLPNARLEEIADAHVFVPLDQPGEVAARIARFVGSA